MTIEERVDACRRALAVAAKADAIRREWADLRQVGACEATVARVRGLRNRVEEWLARLDEAAREVRA